MMVQIFFLHVKDEILIQYPPLDILRRHGESPRTTLDACNMDPYKCPPNKLSLSEPYQLKGTAGERYRSIWTKEFLRDVFQILKSCVRTGTAA